MRWKDLSTGDYIVEQGAIFERKTASDFAASLVDQRLFSQAKRLAEQPLRAGFIIEGGPDDWNTLGVRREALQGALITLTLIFELPVFRSLDPKETAQLLVYAATNSRDYTRTYLGIEFTKQKENGLKSSACWQPCQRLARTVRTDCSTILGASKPASRHPPTN